mgnify:CR=1 FL=1
MGQFSTVTVDAGGTLFITGSILASSQSSIVTINGTLHVGVDYNISSSSVTHYLNGTVTVGGDFKIVGNTSVSVAGGEIAVTGQLYLRQNGIMSGCTGSISYGSFDIFSCGFSYLRCCSGDYGTGCSAIAEPPANSFDFATCGAGGSLPVNLTSFNGIKERDYVILSWVTLSEINSDYFLIEKSLDGKNWSELDQVAGAGNSDVTNTYNLIDPDGNIGTVYYRLTQFDIDGNYTVYKSIVIRSGNNNTTFSMSVSPNPVIDNTNISFSVPEDGVYTFRIVSVNGQLIHEVNIDGTEGTNYLNHYTNNLSRGVYTFIIQDTKGNTVQQKVIK